MAIDDIGDEEGRVFQRAHLQGGGFLTIGNAEELRAGFQVSEADRIDEDEAIRGIDHLDHADDLRGKGLGRRGLFGEKHFWPIERPGVSEKGAARFGGGVSRCSGRGRRGRNRSGCRSGGGSGFPGSRRGGSRWENFVLESASGEQQSHHGDEGQKEGDFFHNEIIRIFRLRSRRTECGCARRMRRMRSPIRSRR